MDRWHTLRKKGKKVAALLCTFGGVAGEERVALSRTGSGMRDDLHPSAHLFAHPSPFLYAHPSFSRTNSFASGKASACACLGRRWYEQQTSFFKRLPDGSDANCHFLHFLLSALLIHKRVCVASQPCRFDIRFIHHSTRKDDGRPERAAFARRSLYHERAQPGSFPRAAPTWSKYDQGGAEPRCHGKTHFFIILPIWPTSIARLWCFFSTHDVGLRRNAGGRASFERTRQSAMTAFGQVVRSDAT